MLLLPDKFVYFYISWQKADNVNQHPCWRAFGRTPDGACYVANHPTSQQGAINAMMAKFEQGDSIFAENNRPRPPRPSHTTLHAHNMPHNEIDISELDL